MSDSAQSPCCAEPGDIETGNVLPILHQVRHSIERFLESGEASIIDLRSIPMGPGEEDRLTEQLGTGEVQVRLDALGSSDVIETRYPGVWLVTHRNCEGEIIGRFIEICAIPQLVTAQHEDVRAGLASLDEQLS